MLKKDKVIPKSKASALKKRKKKIREWVIFSCIYAPLVAILYGTTGYYFPNPIPFLWILYIDLAEFILILSIPLYLVFLGVILNYK